MLHSESCQHSGATERTEFWIGEDGGAECGIAQRVFAKPTSKVLSGPCKPENTIRNVHRASSNCSSFINHIHLRGAVRKASAGRTFASQSTLKQRCAATFPASFSWPSSFLQTLTDPANPDVQRKLTTRARWPVTSRFESETPAYGSWYADLGYPLRKATRLWMAGMAALGAGTARLYNLRGSSHLYCCSGSTSSTLRCSAVAIPCVDISVPSYQISLV